MKLYKVTQVENIGWYTYESAIVAAPSKKVARTIQPGPFYFWDNGFYYRYKHQEPALEDDNPSWCEPEFVKAELIGTTDLPSGTIMSAVMRGGLDESRAIDISRARGALKAVLPDGQRRMVLSAFEDYGRQVMNNDLSYLRFHLIEANRNRDVARVKEYERKLKDYMDEEYEDWS